MFCKNCGKELPDTSKFCAFCGERLSSSNTQTKSSDEKSERKASAWDIFIKILESTGEERESYTNNSSDAVWELLIRISTNVFEEFIEEKREELNKQPYKAIEHMKNVFLWCATEGYWAWYACELFSDGRFAALKVVDLDELIKLWEEEVEKAESLPEDAASIIERYVEFRLENLMEEYSTLKDLANETVERIRELLYTLSIWSYYTGLAEARYKVE